MIWTVCIWNKYFSYLLVDAFTDMSGYMNNVELCRFLFIFLKKLNFNYFVKQFFEQFLFSFPQMRTYSLEIFVEIYGYPFRGFKRKRK